MWRSCFDALFVFFQDAVEDVGNGEDEADDGGDEDVEGEELVVWVEDSFLGRSIGWWWEGHLGDEMNVDVGEDDEYKVFDAHHSAGGEDDNDGQGVELPERQEAFAGGDDGGVVDVLRSGGGDGLWVVVLVIMFMIILRKLDVVICWPYTT